MPHSMGPSSVLDSVGPTEVICSAAASLPAAGAEQGARRALTGVGLYHARDAPTALRTPVLGEGARRAPGPDDPPVAAAAGGSGDRVKTPIRGGCDGINTSDNLDDWTRHASGRLRDDR